jgi:hypothetical protein
MSTLFQKCVLGLVTSSSVAIVLNQLDFLLLNRTRAFFGMIVTYGIQSENSFSCSALDFDSK